MTAIMFGSIGTIVDTSELQRESFNRAFTQHGLDWSWTREDYAKMLEISGGRDRIEQYAQQQGEEVDADAIHSTKSDTFQSLMDEGPLSARPGVVETIRQSSADDVRLALVTTTSTENIAAMIEATDGITLDDFDVVTSNADIEASKPDPAVYTLALERLGLGAESCVAIEDNVDGVSAAIGAGVTCLAFPNQNTADHDFTHANGRIDEVDATAVMSLISPD